MLVEVVDDQPHTNDSESRPGSIEPRRGVHVVNCFFQLVRNYVGLEEGQVLIFGPDLTLLSRIRGRLSQNNVTG